MFFKFNLFKRFYQHICSHVVCRFVNKAYFFHVYSVMNKVKGGVNVFVSTNSCLNLQKFDSTFTVTENFCSIQLLFQLKKLC